MEHLTEPTLLAFLLQTLVVMPPISLSYLAYTRLRMPLRHRQIQQALSQLGVPQAEELDQIIHEYGVQQYIWPILMASGITLATFVLVHPYVVQRGFTAGIWEEVVDIFGADNLFPNARAIVAARSVLFAWFGAYLYSFQMIHRRFLSYDLTPSVYLFTANRFVLAFCVGAVVAIGVGTFLRAAGASFDVCIVTTYLVVFFIGLFPEYGISWIVAIARRTLRQKQRVVKEIPLSDVEGLSIWHQGRLRQEGIENAQNLAATDIPALIVSTSFTVNQIVDWVDQAILLTYAGREQFEALEKVGLRCASDVLTAAGDNERLDQLNNATGLNRDGLRMLYLALQSATNIEVISRFRQQSSMGTAKVEQTTAIHTTDTQPVELETHIEQELKIIREIEGIDKSHAQRLKKAGILTAQALLEKGGSPQGRQKITGQTGISETLILHWVNRADLFRVKGIGKEYADLLEIAGVDTVLELAHRNPESLYQRLSEANQEKKLVRKLPTQTQVKGWIEQAKQLPRMINY